MGGLFNDLKLNPFHFHSLDTFGYFITHSLNLQNEQIKEILNNPKIQYWLDRNKCHGFVYQAYPKSNFLNALYFKTNNSQYHI